MKRKEFKLQVPTSKLVFIIGTKDDFVNVVKERFCKMSSVYEKSGNEEIAKSLKEEEKKTLGKLRLDEMGDICEKTLWLNSDHENNKTEKERMVNMTVLTNRMINYLCSASGIRDLEVRAYMAGVIFENFYDDLLEGNYEKED